MTMLNISGITCKTCGETKPSWRHDADMFSVECHSFIPRRPEDVVALETKVTALCEALGVIKRTASDPWNYDGKIVELAEAALAAVPPQEEGGEALEAALRGLLELIGIDNSPEALRAATTAGWDAIVAARAEPSEDN